MQQALADIALTSLLEGGLDLSAILSDIMVGDAAGYTLVDGVWYSTYTDNGDATDDAPDIKQKLSVRVLLL